MATKALALNKKAVTNQGVALLKMGGGFAAGTMICGVLNKTLKVDASSKLPKRLIAPLAGFAAGTIIYVKAKGADAQSIATGFSLAGVMQGTKVMLPNAGLAGELGLGSLGSSTSYASNPTSWVVRRNGMGHVSFPELDGMRPAGRTGGYAVDAPAHLFGDDDQMAGDDDYNQMAGYDDDQMAGDNDLSLMGDYDNRALAMAGAGDEDLAGDDDLVPA